MRGMGFRGVRRHPSGTTSRVPSSRDVAAGRRSDVGGGCGRFDTLVRHLGIHPSNQPSPPPLYLSVCAG